MEQLDETLAIQDTIDSRRRGHLTTGGAYEANVLRNYQLLALGYLGECALLRRKFVEFVRDAHRRGDRFSAATVARALNFVWLLDDAPERARRDLEAEAWRPQSETFHIQNWLALRSTAHIHLYCGTVPEGMAELEPDIAALERSLMLKVLLVRTEHHWKMK